MTFLLKALFSFRMRQAITFFPESMTHNNKSGCFAKNFFFKKERDCSLPSQPGRVYQFGEVA